MDEEKKTIASEVLFNNVLQISEDMLQTTYALVKDLSNFEAVFKSMSKKLEVLNKNLDKHVVKQKWVKPSDKKACQDKIDQSKGLMGVCADYSKACHQASDNLIAVTERFEANNKTKDIIKNLITRVEDQMKKFKDKGATGSNKPEDPSNPS